MRGLALVLLAVSVVLAGCGAHAVDDPPSLDEVAAATRADPYRFELTLEAEGMPESFKGTATGAADPVAGRGIIRYSFDAAGEKMTLEVRRLGDETYTRFSAASLPGGWTKESTTDVDETIGPFGMFSEPHHAADALARHGRDVEAEPGEPVDGVATTHYTATVPTIEILGYGLKVERREELAAELRKSDSETAQVEAWAGADGLLRKLDLAIPITEEGKRGRLMTSARFHDFGERVAVEAPPASEVQEQGTGVAGLSDPGPSKPCSPAGAPHSAEKVMAALREAGFAVSATCMGSETTIFAFPDDSDDAVFCFVAATSPSTRKDEKGAIVAGNVSCFGGTDASRKLVQRLVNGLQRR